jgi:CheY-like chemotaxis protein
MTRVLIADDDPISLRFLETALQQLGCETVGVGDAASAFAAATAHRFDLFLFDRRMPDSDGTALLGALRAAGVATPAFATSAQIDADFIAALRAAGFAGYIEKPVTLARLHETLHTCLPGTVAPASFSVSPAALPLLDDASALAAIGGDHAALRSLRTMLIQELGALEARLCSTIDAAPLLERLHRLRAACGFCGAPQLAADAMALERVLQANPRDGQVQLHEFVASCRSTADALRAASG